MRFEIIKSGKYETRTYHNTDWYLTIPKYGDIILKVLNTYFYDKEYVKESNENHCTNKNYS